MRRLQIWGDWEIQLSFSRFVSKWLHIKECLEQGLSKPKHSIFKSLPERLVTYMYPSSLTRTPNRSAWSHSLTPNSRQMNSSNGKVCHIRDIFLSWLPTSSIKRPRPFLDVLSMSQNNIKKYTIIYIKYYSERKRNMQKGSCNNKYKQNQN